jgi:hypothetical protein
MAFAMAMASVEENSLKINGNQLSDDTKMMQRHTQGMLMDSLINGEVTEEVKLLRARLYKVIEATNKIQVSGVSYDEDDNPIYTITEKNYKSILEKVVVDDEDNFKPEMVIINTPDTLGMVEGMDINTKALPPIVARREFTPRFLLERYVTKMIVRHVSDTDKLLEFYIPMTTEQFNVNSRLFLKFFKKEISLFARSDLFDIKGIEFITENNDIGIDDGLLHEYDLHGVSKIIEFNGYYVVKYYATLNNVEDIKNYFIHKELDEKYANKEKRKKS